MNCFPSGTFEMVVDTVLRAHKGQSHNGIFYGNHPAGVAAKTAEMFGYNEYTVKALWDLFRTNFGHSKKICDELNGFLRNDESGKAVLVALLHDVIEDGPLGPAEMYCVIKYKFGKAIADDVLALSSDKEQIKYYGKTVYLTDKILGLKQINAIIKLRDRWYNTLDLAERMGTEFEKKYHPATTKILRSLGESGCFDNQIYLEPIAAIKQNLQYKYNPLNMLQA